MNKRLGADKHHPSFLGKNCLQKVTENVIMTAHAGRAQMVALAALVQGRALNRCVFPVPECVLVRAYL
jgi:hypothetical protein